jgi:hypothetical protein
MLENAASSINRQSDSDSSQPLPHLSTSQNITILGFIQLIASSVELNSAVNSDINKFSICIIESGLG